MRKPLTRLLAVLVASLMVCPAPGRAIDETCSGPACEQLKGWKVDPSGKYLTKEGYLPIPIEDYKADKKKDAPKKDGAPEVKAKALKSSLKVKDVPDSHVVQPDPEPGFMEKVAHSPYTWVGGGLLAGAIIGIAGGPLGILLGGIIGAVVGAVAHNYFMPEKKKS
ncbi:MAG: hypothetical protein HY077_14750 [Elusimicrobia bacterium]|nr:hypothetical protein [Elusimicrobiota bacterium]